MVCETTTITVLKYVGYGCAVALFEFLQIPSMQFSILGILMVIDFASGVSKQLVLDPKGLTSHRAWIGILKKGWTLISIIVIALMLSAVGLGDGAKYVVAMTSLLIMAETYSILQNVYIIRTGEKITEYDVVSKIIKAIGDMIVKFIEKTLNNK